MFRLISIDAGVSQATLKRNVGRTRAKARASPTHPRKALASRAAPAKYKSSSNTTHLVLTVNYVGTNALDQTDFCMPTRGFRLRHKGGSSISRRMPVRRCLRSRSSCQPPHGTRSGIGNLVHGEVACASGRAVRIWERCRP